MTGNKIKIILVIIVLAVFVLLSVRRNEFSSQNCVKSKIINPIIGDIAVMITTTGVAEPRNRLEIKPSIGGRIDKVLVREGDCVKEGEILAWMSSTERAALVDAAQSQGKETLEYWEEVYKETPIISPIDGEVIVRSVEPGQTVTNSEAVMVLSDRLIVNAQFDETDIGRVKVGQKARIKLDAYPDIKLEGTVDHIAYESKTINNVTIYDVDILPEEIPEVMRSGMSVTADVIEKARNNVITIPLNALKYKGNSVFVLVKMQQARVIEQFVTVGLNDEKNAEILEGISPEDNIIVQDDTYLLKRKSLGTSPFMPFDKKR